MISNFRLSTVGLSLLIGVAAVPAANAQASISSAGTGSTEDRVTTLERISNAQAQLIQQLQQQLNDTQSDIDSLRGEIQQNTYQLNQVVERQKQLYQQIDSLSSAGAGAAAAGANNAGSDNAESGASSQDNAANANAADTANDDSSGQVGVQSGDANKDYNAAVDLILNQKKFDQAISALQAWTKKYPQSTYQPNANYWLGQLFYNKKKLDDAAYYFATVVKKYPKSPKAPEALLKVGVIMQDKKDLTKAKAVFQQVTQLYAGSAAAKTAQKNLAALK